MLNLYKVSCIPITLHQYHIPIILVNSLRSLNHEAANIQNRLHQKVAWENHEVEGLKGTVRHIDPDCSPTYVLPDMLVMSWSTGVKLHVTRIVQCHTFSC